MNTKRITVTFWLLITVTFLLLTVLHPRITTGLMLLISIFHCVSLSVSRKKREKKVLWRITASGLAGILLVWFFGPFLSLCFSYHASYEYKNDIRKLKTESNEEYRHFPDEIPDNATGIKWKCVPSLMQGNGYEELSFYADESYMESVYDGNATSAVIFTYSEEDGTWINSKTGQTAVFPGISEIPVQDSESILVLETYCNNDPNHPRRSGLYVNTADGYVCFYTI